MCCGLLGKAIDNRAGCAALLRVFERLAEGELEATLYGVVNVQEEIGMRGARQTSARLQPDWAIALDTVPADDTPLAREKLIRLGAGPVIQLAEGRMEPLVGTVVPGVRDLILRTAEEQGFPVQLAAAYGHWTTDAAFIHIAGKRIPTGLVSIPRRYAHSPNELVDLADLVAVVELILALIARNRPGLSFLPVPEFPLP